MSIFDYDYDTDIFVKKILEDYQEWLDRDEIHYLAGDHWDPTSHLGSRPIEDHEKGIDDYLDDYSGRTEATYISGWGLSQLTNSAVWQREVDEYLWSTYDYVLDSGETAYETQIDNFQSLWSDILKSLDHQSITAKGE